MTENTAIIKIIDEITACRNITLEQLHMLLETDDMQAVDYLRKRLPTIRSPSAIQGITSEVGSIFQSR